jgi:hypothetical protein
MRFLILFFCIAILSFVHNDKFVEKNVQINHLLNSDLFLNANVIAYVCNATGESDYSGEYLKIQNRNKTTFYYRAENSAVYKPRKASTIEMTVGHAFQWEEVRPGNSILLPLDVYKTKQEQKKMVVVNLNVKYTEDNEDQKAKRRKLFAAMVKPVSKKPFYAFLTTEVVVNLLPLESMTVISQPYLYTGDVNDSMLKEKAHFLNQINDQLLNNHIGNDISNEQRANAILSGEVSKKKKDISREQIIQNLSVNNYSSINAVIYATPNSYELFYTKQDCQQAIELFKKTLSEALQGITTVNIIQIR